MGMDKYTHIGPFLMIPKVQKSVTRTIRVDENGDKTTNHFNPVTGEEYKTKTVVEDVINVPETYGGDNYEKFEELELDEDAFFQAEGCETNTHSIFLASDDAFKKHGLTSMIGLDINFELENFKVKFKKYLDFFEETYGPIIVDYGVVPYWS